MAPSIAQHKLMSDSTAIISYVDQIIVKTNFDTQTDRFQVRFEGHESLQLATNNSIRLFLSLDYEFVGLSIGVSPKFIPGNGDNELKGASSFSDFSFRFFMKNWTQELQYRNTEGFYVENTGDFLPDWTEGTDPYLQFTDLKTIFWGGSTSLVLNPEFSLRNVVYNTEWQLKSAGSFIPTLRYGFSRLTATLDSGKSKEDSYDIEFAPSYYYTWVVHRNWFVAPFVAPGIGVRFSQVSEEGQTTVEKATYYPVSLDGGLQLGYSSERFIFGVVANFESNWYNEDRQTSVENDRLFAKAYVGYRFQPPKVVKKPFNWVNQKIGL